MRYGEGNIESVRDGDGSDCDGLRVARVGLGPVTLSVSARVTVGVSVSVVLGARVSDSDGGRETDAESEGLVVPSSVGLPVPSEYVVERDAVGGGVMVGDAEKVSPLSVGVSVGGGVTVVVSVRLMDTETDRVAVSDTVIDRDGDTDGVGDGDGVRETLFVSECDKLSDGVLVGGGVIVTEIDADSAETDRLTVIGRVPGVFVIVIVAPGVRDGVSENDGERVRDGVGPVCDTVAFDSVRDSV